MYISIRKYQTTDVEEISRRAEESFLPMLRQLPGFIAFYIVDSGEGWVSSISMFNDRLGAENSTRLAADWLIDNAAGMILAGPEVVMGETLVSYVM